MSAKADRQANYANVTYQPAQGNNAIDLTVTQDDIADETTKDHSEQNWKSVLAVLKKLLEK